MAAPAFPCEARGLSLPECTPCHTSRDIRYIFLESCRNIPAVSHHPLAATSATHSPVPCHPASQHCPSTDQDCDFSLPRHLPAFLALSVPMGAGGSPEGRKRLPVFRRLCGEVVGQLQELPAAPAAPGGARGWRMAQAAWPACNQA